MSFGFVYSLAYCATAGSCASATSVAIAGATMRKLTFMAYLERLGESSCSAWYEALRPAACGAVRARRVPLRSASAGPLAVGSPSAAVRNEFAPVRAPGGRALRTSGVLAGFALRQS